MARNNGITRPTPKDSAKQKSNGVKPKSKPATAKSKSTPVSVKSRLRIQNTSTSAKLKEQSKKIQAFSKTPSNVNHTKSSKPTVGVGRETNNGSEVQGGVKGPMDKSLINFPYDMRINGFSSMLNTVQKSTPKNKKVLMEECDIILECRYCKNLFRSMPNFLSHKQTYCKFTFHPSSETGLSQHIQRPTSDNIEYNFNTRMIDSVSLPIPSSSNILNNGKEFTRMVAIEDNNTRSPLLYYNQISQSSKENALAEESNQDHSNKQSVNLVLEPVLDRKDGVVFQRRIELEVDPSICDSSGEICDQREVLDRDTAILGPDGKVMCTGTSRGIEKIVKHLTAQIQVTQRKMVQNSSNKFPGTCDICKTLFTTEKAFRQHRRDAPDCIKQSSTKQDNERLTDKFLVSNQSTEISTNGELSNSITSLTSPNKTTTKSEEQTNRSAFVRKLFSPSKNSPLIPQSPLKSPMFAKKLLASSSSSKTSPYKKSLAKAVKQFRLPDESLTSNTMLKYSISANSNSLSPRSFYCIRCSRSFPTTEDMSMHLVKCRVDINRPDTKTKQEKITIEVRKHYPKLDSIDDSPTLIDIIRKSVNENNNNNRVNITDSFKSIMLNPDVPEPNLMEKVQSAAHSSSSSMQINTSKEHSLSALPGTYIPTTNQFTESKLKTNDKRKKEAISIETVTNNISDIEKESRGIKRKGIRENELDSLESLVPDVNSSSESDGDRESISNVTDSGISSTTTSDGQIESQVYDLPKFSNVSAAPITGTSNNILNERAKNITRTKDEVDPPTTKENKPSVLNPFPLELQNKRKSFRIQFNKKSSSATSVSSSKRKKK